MILWNHPEIGENERRSPGGAKRQPRTLDPRPTTLDTFTKEDLIWNK